MIKTTVFTTLFMLSALLSHHPAHANGHLYWTNVHNGLIQRSEINNPNPELLRENSRGAGFALDAKNGLIYWLNSRSFGGIRRSELDGTDQVILTQFDDTGADKITLDVARGKMYWLANTELKRANLDGSGIEDVVTGLVGTRDLELDLINDHIYFFSFAGGIERVDLLTGANRINILNIPGTSSDIELDIPNNTIYIASTQASIGLRRVDLDGQNLSVMIDDGSVRAIDVAGSQLYYVRNNNSIYQAELDGNNEQLVLTQDFAFNILEFTVDLDANRIYQEINSHSQLLYTDISSGDSTHIMATVGSETHDIAVKPDGTALFIADQDNEAIAITDLNGRNAFYSVTDTRFFGQIRGISYDPINERLYWVDALGGIGNGAIKRINLDGSEPLTLVDNITEPHDITLDVANDRMYWTENVGSSVGNNGMIRGAALDGSTPFDVLTGLNQTIRGIAIDHSAQRLYFTDHGADQILRVDTDGSNLTSIASSVNPHDIVIDTRTNTLYWTANFGGSNNTNMDALIRCSDLDGSNTADFLTGLDNRIRDLHLVYFGESDVIFTNGFETVTSNCLGFR